MNPSGRPLITYGNKSKVGTARKTDPRLVLDLADDPISSSPNLKSVDDDDDMVQPDDSNENQQSDDDRNSTRGSTPTGAYSMISGAGGQDDDDDEDFPASMQTVLNPALLDKDPKFSSYFDDLQVGYWKVARSVWKEAKARPHAALRAVPEDHFIKHARMMLATTPTPLLNEVLCGNLSLARRNNSDLDKYCRLLLLKCTGRPSHYMLELVSEHGISPSPNHVRVMIDRAYDYITDHKTANRIDFENSAPPPTLSESDAGYRKYLGGKDKSKTNAVTNLSVFLKNLDRWMQSIPRADWHLPLKQSIREIGYAAHAIARIEDHKAKNSSNYIMNLFQTISKVYLADQFKIHGNVIHLCAFPEHAVLGEILWSVLGRAYVETGHGFCHHSAGESNDSAHRLGLDWPLWQEWTFTKSPWKQNVEAESQRVKDHDEKHRAKVKRLAELQAELDKEPEIVEEARREQRRVYLAQLQVQAKAMTDVQAALDSLAK